MAESESTSSSSSSKSSSTKSSSSSEKSGLEQGQEQGYIGETPDDLPNEAYTVTGQGPETAEHERTAGCKLREQQRQASGS